MTESTSPSPSAENVNMTAASPTAAAVPQASVVPVVQPYAPAPAGYGASPVGKIRGTGVCILLMFVTLGIYSWVWFYQTHSEMKRHSGQGIDGGLALVLAIFVGFVMPFITASEVGNLFERRGQRKPVSGATGLWYLPGSFILVGPLVWFIKTNGALNSSWRSLGAA